MLHSLLHCVSRQVRLTTIYSPHHSSQMISQLNKTNQHKLLQEHHKEQEVLRSEQDHPAPSAHPALTPQRRGHERRLRQRWRVTAGAQGIETRVWEVSAALLLWEREREEREREREERRPLPPHHPFITLPTDLSPNYSSTITPSLTEREREILGLPK